MINKSVNKPVSSLFLASISKRSAAENIKEHPIKIDPIFMPKAYRNANSSDKLNVASPSLIKVWMIATE